MARRPSPIVQRLSLEGGDELIAELKRMGLAGEIVGRDLKKAFDAAHADGLTASLKRAQAQMQTLSKSFASVGRQFTNVGRTMSLAITAPIVAGFGFAIKAATDFESKMADIARVVDIPTPDGLERLGEALRAMAVDIGVSIGDLQDIAQAAGQAGIPFRDLASFTELVAKGAVALNLSFGETGLALAKIKTALGLTVPEVGDLIDAVATLADSGAAADAEIIGVVRTVGAIAKAAGVSALDVAALGSSMISMGVDAESAGTAIRNMVLNLSSGAEATDPFRAALAQLGLDAEDVAQRLQTDGIGVIIDLFERLRQQAPEVRLALLQGLFDRRAAQSLAPLIGNLEELDRQLTTVSDRANFAGRANEEFARRADTSAQKMREFKAALEELGITIGNELLPTFTDLTEKATELVNAFSDSGSLVKWGTAIAGVAAAVGPVIFSIGLTIKAIGGLLKGAAFLTGAFVTLNATIAGGGLLAAFAALGSSVGAFFALVGLTAGGVYLLVKAFNAATSAARGHETALDDLDAAMHGIRQGIPGAVEETNRLIDAELEAAKATRERAKANLELLKQQAELEASSAGPLGVPQDTLQLIEQYEKSIRVQEFAIDSLTQRQALAKKAAEDYASGQQTAADAAEDMGNAADEAGEKVKRAFPGPAANVRSLRDNPFAPTTEGVKEAGDEAEKSGKKIEGAVDGIRGKIVTVPEEWRKTGQAAAEMADETTRSVGTIAPALDAVGTAVQETKADLLEIGPAFEELGRQSSNAFTGAGEAVTLFGSVASDTLHGIQERATETATALPVLFQTAATTMAEAFATAFAQVRSELAALQSAVTAALNSMAASLSALRREIAATMAAASAAASSGGGGGGGFAQGGQVFGPGTSTSDSIPAYLSAGEFVVRAKAVDHYGPHIFAALNSLRLPRFDVPRFNAGGIVDSINHSIGALRFNAGGAVPAMAGAGGQVRDMGRLTIGTNSGGDFEVQGPVDVLGQFARVLNRQKLTQAGRGPARIR